MHIKLISYSEKTLLKEFPMMRLLDVQMRPVIQWFNRHSQLQMLLQAGLGTSVKLVGALNLSTIRYGSFILSTF